MLQPAGLVEKLISGKITDFSTYASACLVQGHGWGFSPGVEKKSDRFYKVSWQPESLGRAQGRREGVWTHYCKAQWDPQISRFDEKAWFCETMLCHLLL